MIALRVERRSYRIRGTFTISRGSRTHANVVVAAVSDGVHTGRGECVPYARYGEDVDGVAAAIEGVAPALAAGAGRGELQSLMPPGAARNAVDCALWDLEAKRAGRRAWELTGRPSPEGLVTAFTLSIDTPEAMQAKAAENSDRPLLKIKLAGPEDLDRVRAVRLGAPKSRLIVDANEGWDVATYAQLAPELKALGVEAIEQPVPAADDNALAALKDRPVPLVADESCHGLASLPHIIGKYDYINVKLDKTGGLTEALTLVEAARAAGLKIMVGCMLGSSLAMAPAMVAAVGAEIVDLDGPLLLAEDVTPPLRFTGSVMHAPEPGLWG